MKQKEKIFCIFTFNFYCIFILFPIKLQTESIEQEVIDLLMGALKLCDTDATNPRQFMYTIRSGLIYHHLGSIYCRSLKTETASDLRKKKLLQLCRLYYEKGAKVFESIEAPAEYLAIQNERIDLQDYLFEGIG